MGCCQPYSSFPAHLMPGALTSLLTSCAVHAMLAVGLTFTIRGSQDSI